MDGGGPRGQHQQQCSNEDTPWHGRDLGQRPGKAQPLWRSLVCALRRPKPTLILNPHAWPPPSHHSPLAKSQSPPLWGDLVLSALHAGGKEPKGVRWSGVGGDPSPSL